MENVPVKIFYCHDPADEKSRADLQRHFATSREQGTIIEFYDSQILPGEDWQDQAEKRFLESDITILFISHDLLASDSCYKQMQKAIRLSNEELVVVAPIYIREVNTTDAPFDGLQGLPRSKEPILNSKDQEKVWHEVARELMVLFDTEYASPDQLSERRRKRQEWSNRNTYEPQE